MENDLKLKLEQLHQRVAALKDQIHTEEATKNAFVMPFIQILGYDIFNPTEVIPEYICDIGTKKGEKIDYVIKKEGEPILIIECKHWKENADAHNSQLHRYYHVSKSRFGVLTNGMVYNFYADLERPNIMDDKPFLLWSFPISKTQVLRSSKSLPGMAIISKVSWIRRRT